MSRSKIISSKTIFKGKWLTLKKDHITKPDGSEAVHEVILRNNGIILIIQRGNSLVITKTYRYPVDSYSVEFPMGFINKGEDPKTAAIREAEEETGIKIDGIKFLGEFWAWSGLMNQKIYVYASLAGGEGVKNLDKTEKDLTWEFIKQSDFEKMIVKNQVKNSATLAAYQLWKLKG